VEEGQQAERTAIVRRRASFKAALAAGVTILSGSDVASSPHGDNARELELMVSYGMPPADALKRRPQSPRACCAWTPASARSAGPARGYGRVRRRSHAPTSPRFIAYGS